MQGKEAEYLVNKGHCVDEQLGVCQLRLIQDAHKILAKFHSYAVHTVHSVQSFTCDK